MNKAKELFDTYINGGANFVFQVAASELPETLHLDFKEVRPEKSFKEYLAVYAKALCGFSNADGGIIVWGVKCKSFGGDDPDVTKEAVPIRDLKSFFNWLEGRTDDILQPGVRGIIHHAMEIDNDPNVGFVITYIPRADGPPQMAIAKDSRGFYCRMGSQTRPMEHYQIADRFRERPQPRLEVFLSLGPIDGLNTAQSNCQVDVCVRNVGAGIARQVAVSVNSEIGMNAHSNIQRKRYAIPLDGGHAWQTFALPLEEPLYPYSFVKLAYFPFSFPSSKNANFEPPRVRFNGFCDGSFVEGILVADVQHQLRNG